MIEFYLEKFNEKRVLLPPKKEKKRKEKRFHIEGPLIWNDDRWPQVEDEDKDKYRRKERAKL